MDVLEVEANSFYQPLGEKVVEHQHLEIVPPFDHGRHEYHHFLLSHFYYHLVAHFMKRADQSHALHLHHL
jgi:hypothetical protein